MAAYVLPGKVLVIVVNTSGKARAIDLACDPRPWLPSASGAYEVKHYDGTGAMVQTTTARPRQPASDHGAAGEKRHLAVRVAGQMTRLPSSLSFATRRRNRTS